MRSIRAFAVCLALLFTAVPYVAKAQGNGGKRVLVYTRNYTPDGKGYVHENIASSVAAFQRIGAAHGLSVETSDNPTVFNTTNLARYDAIVFSNSNNQAFATEAQRDAFRAYIHAGHGFLAVHSASGSERDWHYFQQVLGGHFAFHPPYQTFTVSVTDRAFPAVRTLPSSFSWKDECYFLDRLAPDLHVVLTADKAQLSMQDKDGSAFPATLPLAWYHTFDNSREFYIALGHDPADYGNPLYTGILERALLWCLQAKS